MTVNISRSMNQDLREGATDGALKKLHRDRGGLVETTSDAERLMLHGNINGYGVADGTPYEHNMNQAVVS